MKEHLLKPKYEEYLVFIGSVLEENSGNRVIGGHQPFRSRVQHLRRVFEWSTIFRKELEVDEEILDLAILFHDVGYGESDKGNHPKRGAQIFETFARARGFSERVIKEVSYDIENHGDKRLIGNKNHPELTILMEADAMDEEGAMLIAWECMLVGDRGATDYEDVYGHYLKFNATRENIMVTPLARKYWDEKQELRERFYTELKRDLFI